MPGVGKNGMKNSYFQNGNSYSFNNIHLRSPPEAGDMRTFPLGSELGSLGKSGVLLIQQRQLRSINVQLLLIANGFVNQNPALSITNRPFQLALPLGCFVCRIVLTFILESLLILLPHLPQFLFGILGAVHTQDNRKSCMPTVQRTDKHTVSIPDHTHDITQGIFEFGSPTAASLYINGVRKAGIGKDAELDITQYLVEDGSIPRGRWHKIELVPDDLAYITIDITVQGFVQSRGDNTV